MAVSIFRGGNVTTIGGDWNPERVIVIKFDNLMAVKNCFSSDEYKKSSPSSRKLNHKQIYNS